MPELAVIILSWNTRDLLEECLYSLNQFADQLNFDILVIDNGSKDGSQEMVRNNFPLVHLVENKQNLGFAGGNNQGISQSNSPFVLLLNSDAFITDMALHKLMDVMYQNKRAGITGAQLINTDGSFQASHSKFPGLWQEFMILSGLGRIFRGRFYPSFGPEIDKGAKIVDYVEGACLLVRREAIDQVGGLSEDYFMYAEEVDWCYRMQKFGWQVWYQPEAKIIHLGGASSQNRRTEREGDLYRSRIIFFRKHYGSLKAYVLKAMIVLFTVLKTILHGILRFLTRGQKGRKLITIKRLREKLQGV